MSKKIQQLLLIALLSASPFAHAKLIQVQGLKTSNSENEGPLSVKSDAFAPESIEELGGFNELLPYVSPSPDQEDGGTCLFMSTTGLAEWFLRKHNQVAQFQPDDDYNLSPRWWIHQAEESQNRQLIENWYTDTILIFNQSGSVLNRDYRFAKAWFTTIAPNQYQAATAQTPNAMYGTKINWVDGRVASKYRQVSLPRLKRQILLTHPQKNPWSIGEAPLNIVDQVKAALLTNKSPVQVVYNHLGFWHSVFIVGFDEELSIGPCPFIQQSLKSFGEPTSLEALQNKSAASLKMWNGKKAKYKQSLTASLQRTQGCSTKGVFYVRDSIYQDPTAPLYQYDLLNPAADRPYTKKVVLREYDWLIHLANHVTAITSQ